MRIIELARRLARLNFNFRRVPKADVVVVDSDTSEWLSQYFPNSRILVVEIDSGRRYFWILMACLFLGQTTIDHYIARVINRSGASLVTSIQDNFLPLFKLKRHLTKAKVVLIQNGHRTARRDLFDLDNMPSPGDMQVDCYMCFNDAVGNQVAAFTNSPVLTIGSFRSNHVRSFQSCFPTISYISTFNSEVSSDFAYGATNTSGSFSYGSLLQHRLAILTEVAKFCSSEHLEFVILGKCRHDLAHSEYDYYKQALGDIKFTYFPRLKLEDNYQRVDQSWITVSTSSTLGYESLGRGNRTALLQADSHLLGDSSLAIGWPIKLPQEGPFWSTSCTPARISEVLHFLNSSTNDEWDATRKLVSKVIPEFDPGNLRFVDYLEDFGARSI
jgi:surface carbohydrate biosynthesis protein